MFELIQWANYRLVDLTCQIVISCEISCSNVPDVVLLLDEAECPLAGNKTA